MTKDVIIRPPKHIIDLHPQKRGKMLRLISPPREASTGEEIIIGGDQFEWVEKPSPKKA